MALERIDLGTVSIVYERSVLERRPALQEWIAGPLPRAWADRGLDAVVAAGGDGTLLRAVRAYGHEERAFFGAHFGNKGFLMHDVAGLAADARWEEVSYPLLSATLTTDGERIEFDSLNDTVIRSEGPSLGSFALSVGGLSLDVACDGIIVSTPLGSTGYARAAGGPVLPHSARSMVAAAIAPFAPAGLRPVVFDDGECCRVTAHASSINTLSVYSDAEAIRQGLGECSLEIRRSLRTVRLLVPAGHMAEWAARPLVEQGFSIKKAT